MYQKAVFHYHFKAKINTFQFRIQRYLNICFHELRKLNITPTSMSNFLKPKDFIFSFIIACPIFSLYVVMDIIRFWKSR